MEILNILVADDEPGMCSAIRRALEKYCIPAINDDPPISFAVDEVEDGEAVLQKIDEDHPVDILILDYKLPKMSGLDVLKQLTEKQSHVTTVMITAYASIETAVNATRLGAYDFLSKPFTPDELKSTVYRAARVRLLQRKADRLAQEKKRFRLELLSVVSHELKRPLAAVETYLSILMDKSAGDDPDVYRDMIERCRIRAMGMRKLISDLLDSARIESGQVNRRMELLDLSSLLKNIVDLAGPEVVKRNISFTFNIHEDIAMYADRNEIDIVFSNLISNAIKYNRDGGSVYVELESGDGKIFFTVRDTGMGIEKEDVKNIFVEFFRVKNKQTEDIPGSGLGLSIVKKIVDLYKGTINVESQPGQGTAFTLIFDLKQD